LHIEREFFITDQLVQFRVYGVEFRVTGPVHLITQMIRRTVLAPPPGCVVFMQYMVQWCRAFHCYLSEHRFPLCIETFHSRLLSRWAAAKGTDGDGRPDLACANRCREGSAQYLPSSIPPSRTRSLSLLSSLSHTLSLSLSCRWSGDQDGSRPGSHPIPSTSSPYLSLSLVLVLCLSISCSFSHSLSHTLSLPLPLSRSLSGRFSNAGVDGPEVDAQVRAECSRHSLQGGLSPSPRSPALSLSLSLLAPSVVRQEVDAQGGTQCSRHFLQGGGPLPSEKGTYILT